MSQQINPPALFSRMVFHCIAGEIEHIGLDFISDNLYLSTTCGQIYVCNLNSLKCSEIYNLRAFSSMYVAVYPEKGYVTIAII